MKCTIHKVKFIKSNAYTHTFDCVFPFDEDIEIKKKYPNSIPPGYSLWEDEFHTISVSLEYCPKCEQAARFERLKKDINEQ